MKEKFNHDAKFINLDTRTFFQNNGTTESVIKLAYGHNQCSARDAIINNKQIRIKCLHWNEIETWDYAIRCRTMRLMQRDFVRKIIKALLQKIKGKVKEEEGKTKQQHVMG